MKDDSMQAANRYPDDAAIAQRYLAGQLSPSEQEAYEQYFLHDPDAVRELEATARLKVGLASLRDGGQLDSLLRAAPATPRRAVWVAIAASVAVIAIAVGLWRDVRGPDAPALMASAANLLGSSGKPLAVGATYVLMRTRAAEHDLVLELPAAPQALELRVLPESTAPAYDAVLSRALSDGTVAQATAVNHLTPGPDGFVRLYVDSSRIEPGVWLLTVAPRVETGEVPTSTFRLKVPGSDASGDSAGR